MECIYPAPAGVMAFPLAPGETLLQWRTHADGGFVLRVRTADGFESAHDVYPEDAAAAMAVALARTCSRLGCCRPPAADGLFGWCGRCTEMYEDARSGGWGS